MLRVQGPRRLREDLAIGDLDRMRAAHTRAYVPRIAGGLQAETNAAIEGNLVRMRPPYAGEACHIGVHRSIEAGALVPLTKLRVPPHLSMWCPWLHRRGP